MKNISSQNIDIYRQLLCSKKKEILYAIAKNFGEQLSKDVRMSFEACQDNPDKSVDELLKYIDSALVARRSHEIEAIDDALRKIKEGAYGSCEECGCEIPPKRLEVMPHARLCVTCQLVMDRRRPAAASGGMTENEITEGDDSVSPEDE